MKLWNLSTQVLAALLAAVVSASGPSDGDAVADPNSAVVQLTTSNFKEFLDSNPLVLAEFFAPWCGYCKQLAPAFAQAADSINESHPNIKLAQIDCTVEEQLCQDHEIRGYPTLKVFRGSENAPTDYDGPRDAEGIADYVIKETLPPVLQAVDADELDVLVDAQKRPFIVQVLPEAGDDAANATYNALAAIKKNDLSFISVSDKDAVASLNKKVSANLAKVKKPTYMLVHPGQLDDVREFSAKEVSEETLKEFISTEIVPYFGDINRDTYTVYMTSPTPLAYYFYKEPEQREAVELLFAKLGKQHKGKVNFVGLDANVFGRHAEILNMDPEIVPLFVIQTVLDNKKYGIDQKANPDGPSHKDITKFVDDFLAKKLSPIVKSEPLPTDEEKAAQSVVKLVAHNHDDVLSDLTKDVLVKYYAPWCGHCKKLAPIWEELAEVYGSNSADAKVIIADLDHTANDVDTPVAIEGYPTLVLYPANGKIDKETGIREAVVYSQERDLESLIEYIRTEGGLKVDGAALKASKAAIAEDEEEVVVEEKEQEHDEL